MKFTESLLFVTIFFASQYFCSGQENQPIKIDEFEKTSCADLQVRLYSGLQGILENQNTVGYVVVYGKRNNLLKSVRYESWVKGTFENANFDETRYKIVRGADRDDFLVQLWQVPADFDIEFFLKGEWNYSLPASTKPFIFTAYTWEGGPCSVSSHTKIFADFLLSNPNARGHLVIRNKTNTNFLEIKTKVLDEIVNRHKVPRYRLKLFYVTDKDYPYSFTDVEFWFVPKSLKTTPTFEKGKAL